MDWTPTLKDRAGPVYLAIADALDADIASGRLRRGQQLPTHRALAKALGVDLTTVTRAYGEARERGLTDARVGQGTFVAESRATVHHPSAPRIQFDLSMNLPPQPLEADLEGRITRGIAALKKENGLSAYLNYREMGGSDDERGAAAAWLRARIPGADADRLLICPGTQTAILALLMTLTAPDDVVLTETLTYPGLKAAASYMGVRLVGVATDAHGILPDVLEQACTRHAPKALYLIPTIHNPTTATLPPVRRRAVAAIVAAHGLHLLEDDAYGALDPDAVPLAALAPEQTYHMASLSKCIAPGLRVSLLLTPSRAQAAAVGNALRTAAQMPVSLMAALAARWRATNSRPIPTAITSGSHCRAAGAGRSSPPTSSARAWPSSPARRSASRRHRPTRCASRWAPPPAGRNWAVRWSCWPPPSNPRRPPRGWCERA